MRALAAMLLLALLAGGCGHQFPMVRKDPPVLAHVEPVHEPTPAEIEAKASREIIVAMLQYMVQYLGSLSRALDSIDENLGTHPAACPPRILPPLRSAPDPGAP